MIWADKRLALARSFTKWAVDNNCDANSPFNVIGFLTAKGLLDEDKTVEFIDKWVKEYEGSE